MNSFRRLMFWVLNKPEDREILNRWKREGRIPENYCGSIQEIAGEVEDEFRREKKIGEFIRNDNGTIQCMPKGWEKIRDELYKRE